MENQSIQDMLDEAAARGNILVYYENGRPKKYWAHNAIDTVFFWGAGKKPQSRKIKGSVFTQEIKKKREGYEEVFETPELRKENIDERRYYAKQAEKEEAEKKEREKKAVEAENAILQKGREALLASATPKPTMKWF